MRIFFYGIGWISFFFRCNRLCYTNVYNTYRESYVLDWDDRAANALQFLISKWLHFLKITLFPGGKCIWRKCLFFSNFCSNLVQQWIAIAISTLILENSFALLLKTYNKHWWKMFISCLHLHLLRFPLPVFAASWRFTPLSHPPKGSSQLYKYWRILSSGGGTAANRTSCCAYHQTNQA